MLSTGRSSDWASGGAHRWPSPVVPKFPSRGNFGDDGHVAKGNESGFPKFPQNKYLGDDSISGKAGHVWHFFLEYQFSKMICWIWTLWWFISLALHFARSHEEPWHLSPNCGSIKPEGASTVSGDSAGDLENLTRTHDILFWQHVCVSLHCMWIGAPRTPCFLSAIPERFVRLTSRSVP